MDLLVGIIPNVCREFDEVDFLIGGDGSKMLALQEMVERERLQDRVTFLGSVPRNKVRDVLVRGHVFLNCSLTESFCIAILEAASCGLRVVSTNVGGVPEVLPDDLIMLSEPKVDAMVETIRTALSSPFGGKESETHKRVSEMYSWERVALETIKVYETVLKQRRRGFIERMACYQSLGGLSGFVACSLALIVEVWLHFVEWWIPCKTVDRVPDVISKCQSM